MCFAKFGMKLIASKNGVQVFRGFAKMAQE